MLSVFLLITFFVLQYIYIGVCVCVCYTGEYRENFTDWTRYGYLVDFKKTHTSTK